MTSVFTSFVALMATAVLMVWLFRRLNLPAILAYLVSGVLLGPDLLSVFTHPEDMHLIAEIGIVFLLFSLGLEFSLPKMIAMRHLVFGVGLGQMLLTTGFFMLIAMLAGLPLAQAFVIGGMLALSSTAIVIKQAGELGIINTPRSQMAVSILLFQDLAVVPFLIVIPLLADGNDGSLLAAISIATLKGVLVVVILMSIGKWLLPRVFIEVANTRTDELFVLTTIVVALLAAGLTYAFGLSMALGAFLAGMMLSESQYRHQLEADIRPFRDILMGLFFATVGMQLQLDVLLGQFHWVVMGLLVLLVVKVLLVRFAAWLVKAPATDAWATGFKVCQMGEFSFVIGALAVDTQVLTSSQVSLLVSIGVLSMAVTPSLITHSLKLAKHVVKQPEPDATPPLQDGTGKTLDNHVLILGFGRVGQSVARMLHLENIHYAAIDADPVRVLESRNAGEQVFFGDAGKKDILHSAGIASARLVLITFDQTDKVVTVINTIKSINDALPVVVRTRKDYQLEQIYDAGAVQVVPEILEGSLMLVSQVLHYSGVPMSRILKRVRDERKGHYGHMHGFYPGETTEISYGTRDKLEFMHAVAITDDAFAKNKSLQQLDLLSRRIFVKEIRRGSDVIDAADTETVLQTGDILVISGKPRRIERVERFLLEGD
ncbi:monovalent cation:proton antiporter family protein [Aestuariibacter salexigens]|uniref:monovalent cation:proton antiporter family protein n=1 Tax=Aestuariibacter salexigens TaxID=226010 RepID=UPI000421755B|nr:monovalent cation:proton antiporter family protein [Aestuariibacter salexigens]